MPKKLKDEIEETEEVETPKVPVDSEAKKVAQAYWDKYLAEIEIRNPGKLEIKKAQMAAELAKL